MKMIYSPKNLISGLNKLADVVKVTLGPKGSNVMLDEALVPTITNDGVSIARRIKFSDPVENMGAKLIKEVAEKQNDLVGDGTTTAIVLAQAIVKEGLKSKLSSVELFDRITLETSWVVEKLRKMARRVEGCELARIAELSCESSEMGNIVAEVIGELGSNAAITVEESPYFGITKEIVKGMQIQAGFISPYMQTSENKAEYVEIPVLVTDQKIVNADHMSSIMNKIHESGKNRLVVFSDGLEGDALTTTIVNKMHGHFNVLAVNIGGFGERKKESLKDIAILSGATFITKEIGRDIKEVELVDLGNFNKVVSDKNTTVVIGQGDVSSRIGEIKSQLTEASQFEKQLLEQRLSGLSGGVAVIRVGAATESEMKYKKLKLEDGICAIKAAIEEGVVPGAGFALLKASEELDLKILKKAIRVPYELIQKQVKDSYVLDPLKVTRMALENASSMAGIFLTTAAVVDEK
jgi:chaperonin GroEL